MLVTARLAALLLLAAAGAPTALAAERAPARPAVALDAGAPAEEASPEAIVQVDESALRYYAGQHATARVEAEIRRLRALHPGWEPPADLYRSGASDEQALWDLYGRDRIDDLKLEIERRAARQPGWRPSQEMVDKLHRKELRSELVAASDRSDWAKVLGLVERAPLLVEAADLDVVWRVAEAAARSGDAARAGDLYRLALDGARTPEERIGTLRKALAALGTEATRPLFDAERTGPDGKREFDAVRLDLARTALGEWLRGDAARPLPQVDLDRLAAAAEAPSGSAEDAALAGWVAQRRKDAAARRWFDLALARGGAGKAALGAVLVRDAAGDHAGALDLAQAKSDDPEVGALFLDLLAVDLTRPAGKPIPAERVARFAALTETLESGDAAQALAWYAHGARQWEAARGWFAKAMAWRPSAKSAEGHLLALAALGDRAGFDRFDADYRGRFPDLPKLRFPDKGAKVAAAPAAPRACPAVLADRARRGDGSAGEAIAAGWCLMEAKRAEEAALAFAAARRAEPRLAAEAAYGQALAHLRSGRTADAAEVAASGGLTPARRDEIGRIVLAQQAIALFDRGDWAATLATLDRRRAHVEEPRDLMTMRAWSLYHLGRRSDAFALFGLIDAQLSTRESRAGLAATGPTLPGRS